MDMARSLGHVDGGQEEALEALCRAAQAELAGRLRPEVRSEDCEDAFILACAWLALAGLAAGETGGGRFTAGEVTIQEGDGAARPVCVGEETLYWWALLAVEDGEAQTEQT